MKRFIEGEDRTQVTLLPDCLDDYIAEDNPVRAVDAFVEELDLKALGFAADPAASGRPGYHPAVLLKLYIYGYLNRVPSSRRLEREAQRNVELMWLTGRLAPDCKTIADRGHFNSTEIKATLEAGITPLAPKPMTSNAKAEGRFGKGDFIYLKKVDQYQCPAGERAIYRFWREEGGLMLRIYWTSTCPGCAMRVQCTTAPYRRIRRWEHEHLPEAMQRRLDRKPNAMTLRRCTIEHVFGTLKYWMGSTHFLTRRLHNVGTEMSLQVLAYNFKRVIQLLGMRRTMQAMRLLSA